MISKYWRDFYVLKKDYFYHVGAKEINRKPIVEALVMNYIPTELKVTKYREKQLVLLEKKAKYSARE